MTNPISQFMKGFFYPLQAGRVLRLHPSLIRYIIIPFAINVSVFGLAVYLGISIFQTTVMPLIPQGDAWYWVILAWLLWLLAVLITAILVFFTFTAIGVLIASPFNDLLSERTEEALAGKRHEEPFVFRAFLTDVRKIIINEAKKILLFVLGMALLLFLNLIPGLGPILYSILSLLFTIFFLVVEYTGYFLTRKRLTFHDQRRFIFSRPFLMLGFGSGVLCLLAVPFLQFLCIPLAVIGATQLCHETTVLGPQEAVESLRHIKKGEIPSDSEPSFPS